MWVVLGGLIQFFLHPAGGSDPLGEGQDAMGALQEHSGNIQEQDLVTARAGDGLLLQGPGLLEEAHLDGDAAGQHRQQDSGQDQGSQRFSLRESAFPELCRQASPPVFGRGRGAPSGHHYLYL